MNQAKREALEAAGFRVGDAAEFLGMDDLDRRYVEFRLAVMRAIYRRRTALKLTQRELAERIGSSQPRVARMESGEDDVSLNTSIRALLALGGGLEDLLGPDESPPPAPRDTRRRDAGDGARAAAKSMAAATKRSTEAGGVAKSRPRKPA
jgi:transcriptional regulator with XRE-family HTH domain